MATNPVKKKKVKRRITATGEDITGKTPKERAGAIKASGFKPQTEVTPRQPAQGVIGSLLEKDGKVFNVPGSEVENVAKILEKQKSREVQKQVIAGTLPTTQKDAAAPILEKAGAFEQVTPKEVSLQGGSFVPPVPIGGAAGAGVVQGILQNPSIREFMASQVGLKRLAGIATTSGEAFPALPDETIREAALREIKKKSFEEGVSLSESVGALIEAIPLAGTLVAKYVGGLVEAPFANAREVIGEIDKIKEAASTGQEKVRNGLEDPDFGLDRARKMEEDISRLEGRLKLLKETSAILQANTDQVNKIQEGILEAREKVSRYKRASSFGLTAQLTGTGRVPPTDEQLFFELQRLKGGR